MLRKHFQLIMQAFGRFDQSDFIDWKITIEIPSFVYSNGIHGSNAFASQQTRSVFI
jgi:hypothetical protein